MKNLGHKIYLKYIFYCFIICIFIPSLLNSMTLRTGITSTVAYWKPWFIEETPESYDGIASNGPLLMIGPCVEIENNSRDIFITSGFKFSKETKYSSYTNYEDEDDGWGDFEYNYSRIKRYDSNLRLELVTSNLIAVKPEFKYIYHESVEENEADIDFIFQKGEYYIASLGLGLKYNWDNGHGASFYMSRLFIKENIKINNSVYYKTNVSSQFGNSIEYNWIYNSDDIGFSAGVLFEWYDVKEKQINNWGYVRNSNKVDVTCGINIAVTYRIM